MKLQVGDWVRTDTGQEATIALICDTGREVYLNAPKCERAVGLVKFEISSLTKIDPPPER